MQHGTSTLQYRSIRHRALGRDDIVGFRSVSYRDPVAACAASQNRRWCASLISDHSTRWTVLRKKVHRWLPVWTGEMLVSRDTAASTATAVSVAAAYTQAGPARGRRTTGGKGQIDDNRKDGSRCESACRFPDMRAIFPIFHIHTGPAAAHPCLRGTAHVRIGITERGRIVYAPHRDGTA